MSATQLLLEIEEVPGAITRLAALLGQAGVEIAGVWAIPSVRSGAAAPVDEGAAALAAAASRLADAGINTICAYATADGTRQVAVILNALDAPKAAAALQWMRGRR